VESWAQARRHPDLPPALAPLFDRYVEPVLAFVRRECKTLVPLPPINMVETLCKARPPAGALPLCCFKSRHIQCRICTAALNRAPSFIFPIPAQLLEGLLPSEPPRAGPGGAAPAPLDRRLLEAHFVFACVWAFGGCLLADRVADHRAAFAKWWAAEHKAVPFPPEVRPARAPERRRLPHPVSAEGVKLNQ
jgi:dynein heavy chain